MLNVSSSSWHYRLRAQVFDTTPKDLCSYFWSTAVAAIALSTFYIARGVVAVFRPLGRLERFLPYIGVAIVGALIISMAVWTGWALLYNTGDFLWAVLKVVLIILGIAVAVIIIIFTLMGLVELHKRWRKKHPIKAHSRAVLRDEPEGDSSWTLMWAFLTAKKKKVCPIIAVDGRAPWDVKQVLED